MASPSLTIRINADASGVTHGVQQATQQINSIGTQAQSARNGMNGLNESMRAAGGAGAGLARGASELQNISTQAGNAANAMHSMTAAMSQSAQASTQAANAAQRATQELHNVNGAAGGASSGMIGLTSSVERFGAVVAGAFSLASIVAFSNSVLKVNIEMQAIRSSLDTVVHGAENAAIAFAGIQAFAATTQFSVKEVTEGFIQMKALGLAPTEQLMHSLASTAGALNKPFKQLVAAVADASTGAFERLPEAFGVTASKAGDKVKFMFNGMETEVENNANSIIAYLQKIGDVDFAGGVEKSSATIKGALSNLDDAWGAFQDHLLDSNKENAIGQWVVTAAQFLGDFDVFINGAVTSSQKLNKVTLELGQTMQRVQAHNEGGSIRQFWDGLTGYDENKELNKIESLKKARHELTLQEMADKQAFNKVAAQTPAQIAAAEKQAAEKKQDTQDKFTKSFSKDNAALEALEIKAQTKELGALTDAQKKLIHEKIYASEISKAESASNKAAHKQESEAAREAKKEQDGFNKLIESTPIGAYNAKVSELNNALRKGGIDQNTYNDLMEEAAAKYEKGTVGIEKITAAEKERQRIFDQTARGKFEKSTDELRKAKPNMSEAEYANKQDKIGVDYLHESGLNKDAKTQVEEIKNATDEAKKFHDEMTKATTALESFGDSGKMAFDGLLGGISAVAGAAMSFRDEMSKLDDALKTRTEDYNESMKTVGLTEEQKNNKTKDFNEYKAAYDAKSLQTEINGARQIAGAAAKMFGEKSTAAKAFHAVEMGLAIVSMAMSAKKMIVDVAAGAAAMFGQSGWAGFAGVAAMTAVMAGLGFAISGGSSKEPVLPEHTKTTGGVLGDSEAQSHSINNIVSKLDEIHASEYPELRNIASAMGDLKSSISAMIVDFAKIGGIKLASVDNTSKLTGAANIAGGIGLAISAIINPIGALTTFVLSKIPVIGDIINGISNFIFGGLFGKKSASVKDGGIKINAQSLGGVMDSGTIDGAVSTIIDTKTSSWFKTSHKISEILTALDESVSAGMGKVFSSMAVAVGKFWDFIGGDVNKGLESIRSFIIPFANIKTFGLKDTDIQKAFEDYSSMTFDDLVKHVFGGFVSQFQAVGESIGDTMNRLVTDTVQVKTAFVKMGADMSQTNDHLVIFSESMISMAGGLKNLITLADNFTSKFTSKDVKNQLSEKDIRAFASDATNKAVLASQGKDMTVINNVLAALGNKNITTADVTTLKDSIGKFGADLGSASSKLSAASDKYSLPDAAAAYANAFEHTGAPTKNEQSNIDFLHTNPAWKNIDASTTTEQASAMAVAAGASSKLFDTWTSGFGSLKSFFAANSANQAQGIAELTALGLPTDKATFDANKADEAAKAKPVEALTVTALQLTDALSTVTDNLMNYAKIVEDTANITKTAGDKTNSTRLNEIAGLSTQNEKTAKADYYTAFDTKKFADDTIAAEQRIYDLRHTAAEVSIEELNRSIVKVQNEATATDTLNGFTQKRIDLMKQEYAATQFVAYDKKLSELKTGVLNLGLEMTETDIITNNLKQGIQDLRATYVELHDAAGKVINPVSQLIELLIDTQVATSLKANNDALKAFGKTAKEWVLGMNTGSLGTAKSQMDAAQADFDKKYAIITDTTDKYTNTQKSEAMSGMTGAADKLVSKIHEYGANGDVAQGMVKDVVSKMEGLPELASLQTLTFDELKTSNELLTTIADNTGKTAAPTNTTAMTLKDALDTSVKISETATNTKSTADAIAEFTTTQIAINSTLNGINVNLSGDTSKGLAISPTSLSLDATGVTSVLNSQLLVLQDIYAAINNLPSGAANNKGGDNVVPMTTATDSGTTAQDVTQSVVEDANPVANFGGIPLTNYTPPTENYFKKPDVPTIDTFFPAGALAGGNYTPAQADAAFAKYQAAHTEFDPNTVNTGADEFNNEIKAYIKKISTPSSAQSATSQMSVNTNSPIEDYFSNGMVHATAAEVEAARNAFYNTHPLLSDSEKSKAFNDDRDAWFNAHPITYAQNNDPNYGRHTTASGGALPSAPVFSSGTPAIYTPQVVSAAAQDAARPVDTSWSTLGQQTYQSDANVVFSNGVYDTKWFANGGITNEPSIFGEAGWEAAVPLPDGRTIPVTMRQTSPHKADNSEVVAILTDGFDALLEAVAKLQEATTKEQRKTTTATQKTSDKLNATQKAWALN